MNMGQTNGIRNLSEEEKIYGVALFVTDPLMLTPPRGKISTFAISHSTLP